MGFKGTPMKNKELVSIYNYLTNRLTRPELTAKLGRTRTNTYYYIGRATHYWIRRGILRFRKINSSQELGGNDVKEEK